MKFCGCRLKGRSGRDLKDYKNWSFRELGPSQNIKFRSVYVVFGMLSLLLPLDSSVNYPMKKQLPDVLLIYLHPKIWVCDIGLKYLLEMDLMIGQKIILLLVLKLIIL